MSNLLTGQCFFQIEKYICVLCAPKRVVNIFVLINHVTKHARGQVQCDPDYEDHSSMLTNYVLVNKTYANNPCTVMY